MNNRFRRLPVLLPLLLLCAFVYAQEEQLPDLTIRVLTPEQNRIDMDIRTSSLSDLAAWCRTLGLSEGGTSAELAKRLRTHFNISDPPQGGVDKRKVITIESARSTEYFRIEAIDEDYARLSGEVKINLKDGDAIHRIHAWDILFNRTRNIITASGGVVYVKEEGDKIETFRGESITVDLDNWESIFLGGISERSLQSDSTTYLFAGTVISRDEEEVTILSQATISSAQNVESLWSLNASQVWLLPGSDFAIFNAVLKVGEIPVLYIPFFYYPADEVVFHPVIGYRTREGNFVQTTTYILGRPRASSASESSLTKILGNSNDMEKTREGMFLRSTGKKYTSKSETNLRAMVDYYANLGAYLGADLDLPAKGMFGVTNLSMGIGLTRTVNSNGGNFSPFAIDGTTDWNNSSLFSMEVPFRYRFRGNSSLSGKYGSFTWTIPYYSDPYMDGDFLHRSESMDWVNMIQKGAMLDEIETKQTEYGNYSWQFTSQFNLKFPTMSPYITNISISNITNTIAFRTLDNKGTSIPDWFRGDSPMRKFYAPDTATLYSLSGSVSGTPLSLGGAVSTGSSTGTGITTPELPEAIKNIGIPRSPFEEKKKEEAKKKDPIDTLVPPVLNQRFDAPRIGNTRFSAEYRIAPSAASTLKFNSLAWKEYSDIDWNNISSILSNINGNAEVKLNLNHTEGFFSNAFSYSGTGTWRQYLYMNEEAEEYKTSEKTDPQKIANAKLAEYRQSFFSTSYGVTSSLRPLFRNTMFGSSNLQYSLKGLAVKSNFTGTDAENPEWEMIWAEWDKEKIDTHNFSTNIMATVMDKSQTISLTAELPPRDSALTWRAGFRIWVTETDANMRILFPGEPDKRKLEPFNFTERINFGTYGNLSQSLVLNTEEREITTLTTRLNLSKWGVTAAYAAQRMLGWEYIPPAEGSIAAGVWKQRENNDDNMILRSRDFSLSYSKSFNKKELWDKRMQYTITTSANLNFDLQRYTSSTFNFNLIYTMGISKFLDLTMSASSENAAIYRYIKDIPPFNSAPINMPDGPQNNLFLDLFNSFRFDDEKLRTSSSFKMKNFRIAATHYLGDWTATLNWTMSPYRPPNSRQFEINNEISFLIQWIPINEIKSDISYNKRNTPEWTVKQ